MGYPRWPCLIAQSGVWPVNLAAGGRLPPLHAAGLTALLAVQERGNASGQWWADRLKRELGDAWVRVGLRQLSGLLCLVFGHADLQVPYRST